MAGTVQISESITVKDGTVTQLAIPGITSTYTQSTNRFYYIVKNITTTEASVDFSTLGIATNGIMQLENMDTTNFVQWGTTSGDYCGKLDPNSVASSYARLKLNSGKTLYLKADTAACNVRILMCSN